MVKKIEFPCVMKLPDSAFSLGVMKINNYAEFEEQASRFFKESSLIVVQSFLPTPFDWRIGIIDGVVLFACRYYMAPDHWQIYNWQVKGPDVEGDFDVVPNDQVPEVVLQTAIKATKLIGDGLYGVDMKQIGNQAYIIEINDNPNIDDAIENQLAGDALYTQIMQVFLKRMKQRRGHDV